MSRRFLQESNLFAELGLLYEALGLKNLVIIFLILEIDKDFFI
jgi:hypothetical protein